MKRKLKLAFDALQREMEVLLPIEQVLYLGGTSTGIQSTGISWDCVLNCFDYLDDGILNGYSNYYEGGTYYTTAPTGSKLVPYDPSEIGGFYPSDFSNLGANGGLNVTAVGAVFLTAAGTSNGDRVMMTMPGANGDHAVVIIGASEDGTITYFDPTTGIQGTKNVSDSGLAYYTVSKL